MTTNQEGLRITPVKEAKGLSTVLVFVDGFGIGRDDAAVNPYITARTPVLDRWLGGKRMVLPAVQLSTAVATLNPTDACLGVEGFPQSATGQTALLTGLNAPAAMGRHISGFPTPTLVAMLNSAGILHRLRAAGLRIELANAYSPEYFTSIASGKRRHAAIAVAALGAGMVFRSLDDLRQGQAVYQDVTSQLLIRRGHSLPELSPETAGGYLAALARQFDFTLFEYFQTDIIGHTRDMGAAVRIVETLDRFVGSVAAGLGEDGLLIIASDHGNIEDLSVSTHTRNPIPTILVGRDKDTVGAGISSLTDITPAVLAHLGVSG